MKIYENEKQELVIDNDETVTYVGENSCVFGSFWTIEGKPYRYVQADPRGIDGCHIMFEIETGQSGFMYLKGAPKDRQEFYDKLENPKETSRYINYYIWIIQAVIFALVIFILINTP